MKEIQMIRLYSQVCECYNSDLQYEVQRFSNNGQLGLITDEELMTIYLFCVCYEGKKEKKEMHHFISSYWKGWFPTLPTYEVFSRRLNRITDAFKQLSTLLLQQMELPTHQIQTLLVDSFPVKVCSGRRSGKVATDLCDKTFCASKQEWYYGVKVHAFALKRTSKLPLPQSFILTPASEHDLSAAREEFHSMLNHTCTINAIVADKAYIDSHLKEKIESNQIAYITPMKPKKGESELIKQFDAAYNQLLNTAISSIRQPIESLFNWIIQKTGIQQANKVRSGNGLLLHIYGKITAALLQIKQQFN